MKVISKYGVLVCDGLGAVVERYTPAENTPDENETFSRIFIIDLKEWQEHYKKPFPEEVPIQDVGYFYLSNRRLHHLPAVRDGKGHE